MAESQQCGGVRIRPADEQDIREALCLEGECFRGYYAPHRFRRPQFLAYLRGKQSLLFVAARDEALVGYLAGSMRRSHGRLSAYVASIAVAPACRGSGVGGRLMRRFIEEAKRRSCQRIALHVALPNEAGIRFFAKWGFRRVRRLSAYYGRGVDGVLMSRQT